MKRFLGIAVATFVVLIAAACILLPTRPVSAASSAALSIVPKKNYVIEPGKSVDDTLTIRNLDPDHELDLTLRVIDFTFTDDGGTPKLMLDPKAPETTWSLKPFMTVPDSVTIPAGSSKSLPMSVAIPAGHGAGSYYSAILYSAGPPDGGGNVGLSASGVTLVFTSIPGQVTENLKLKNFGNYTLATDKKPAHYTFITTQMPTNIGYTLQNNGNVTEAPVGSITLTSMFGQKQVIHDVNPSKSLALIGQTRTFVSCIQLKAEDVNFHGTKTEATQCGTPSLWPGRYTAVLDVFYGQNGNNTQEIVKTTSFWYLPWWSIVAFIIALLIVAYFVWRIVRGVRRLLNGTRTKKSRRRK